MQFQAEPDPFGDLKRKVNLLPPKNSFRRKVGLVEMCETVCYTVPPHSLASDIEHTPLPPHSAEAVCGRPRPKGHGQDDGADGLRLGRAGGVAGGITPGGIRRNTE